MSKGTEARDFAIEGSEVAPESTHVYGGEVDIWEAIGPGLQRLDIQPPADPSPSPVVHAGDVEIWVQVSTEKTRQIMALSIVGLFVAWIFLGFILLLVAGNVWLLVSGGVLAAPLKYVLDYYFRHSEQLKKGRE